MDHRIDPDKLSQRLAAFGFALNLPEVMKGGISFVRPSAVERLYEHVLIRAGKVAYAEAVISAATFTSCHACVSEKDDRFRAFLSEGARDQTSLLVTSATAQAWQKLLLENADTYCKRLTAEKGPFLHQRLQPVFTAVNWYVQKLGDMFAILDREFSFISETSADEQAEVDRLATKARQWLYLNSEDAKLASIALVRFGGEVEGSALPFQKETPGRDDYLSSRLILLADYIRAKRVEYDTVGGMSR